MTSLYHLLGVYAIIYLVTHSLFLRTMFNESIDILWLALALAILVLTSFLCWVLYYIAQLLKQSNNMVQEIRHQIERVEGLIDKMESMMGSFHDKFASTGAALGVIAKGVQYFFQRKADKDFGDEKRNDGA